MHPSPSADTSARFSQVFFLHILFCVFTQHFLLTGIDLHVYRVPCSKLRFFDDVDRI